jgi:hypothetical protein
VSFYSIYFGNMIQYISSARKSLYVFNVHVLSIIYLYAYYYTCSSHAVKKTHRKVVERWLYGALTGTLQHFALLKMASKMAASSTPILFNIQWWPAVLKGVTCSQTVPQLQENGAQQVAVDNEGPFPGRHIRLLRNHSFSVASFHI